MRPSLHADANVHDMAQTSLLHLTHGASAVASLVEKGETEAKLSMSMSMSDFSLGFFSGRMWSKELVSPLKELLVATSCMQLVFTRLMDLHMSVNCFGMIRQQAPGLPQLSMSGSKSDTRIHMGWDWVSTCFSSESPVILVRHADHKLGCRKLLPHTSTQAKHLPRRPNSSMPPPHWAATLGSTQHRSAGC